MRNKIENVFEKTGRRCHICGDPLELGRYGKGRRGDGAWEMDHVHHRRYGGGTEEANLLPACKACNRLRWHAAGHRIREMLEFGLIARREVKRLTKLGRKLLGLRHRARKTTAGRGGKVSKLASDPVAHEPRRRKERHALREFLRKRQNRKRAFFAAELSAETDVPKSRVRSLLDTEYSIDVRLEGGQYRFQGRNPKVRSR